MQKSGLFDVLQSSAARDYKILWKEDFISFLKDSPYFTHPAVVSNSAKVQRYSDKYVVCGLMLY